MKEMYNITRCKITLVIVIFFLISCDNKKNDYNASNKSEVFEISPVISNVYTDSLPYITPGEKGIPRPKVINLNSENIVVTRPDYLKPQVVETKGRGFFTNYTTDDGIALDNIQCSYQDKSGNLWFGTGGGGVSRYDGKSFVNFTTANGLVNNNIKVITEDVEGNLWFGTWGWGVSRYDGRSFKSFNTKEGLSGNVVRAIMVDKNGHVWFGTEGGGLSCYDGVSFKNYTVANGLVSDNIYSMIEDTNGYFWIGTQSNGVSRYDGKSFVNFNKSNGLVNNTVNSIVEDKDGNLWFGTEGGVSRFDGQGFVNYTVSDGLAHNKIWSIIEDVHGELWFATVGGGVSHFDGHSFENITTTQGLVNNIVWTITEDKNGNLWMGTNGGGLSCYGGKSFMNFTTRHGLAHNKIWTILEDKNGKLWFGTDAGGVSCYDGHSFVNYSTGSGLANNTVWSIIEDKCGNFWFGTHGGGVSCYDGEKFRNFTTEQGLANNDVLAIVEDDEGNLWFGTWKGVSRYDGKSFVNFTSSHGLAHNIVWSIIQDRNGDLWFGTAGGGVSRFDGHSFATFTTSHGLAYNSVFSIAEDKYGNLWFGTERGLSRYDGNSFITYNTKDGLPDNYISQILFFQDHVFLGTNFGLAILSHFVPGTQAAQEKSRLQPQNSLDNDELSNYIPVFEIYNSSTGYFVKDINVGQNALYLDSKGIIWAGTGSDKTGLVRIDYNAIHKYDKPPKLVFQSLMVNNEKISWYNLLRCRNKTDQIPCCENEKFDSLAMINEEIMIFGHPLAENQRCIMQMKFGDIQFDGVDRFYPMPENLVLPFKNNNITFEFAAIEPARPYLVKYQYMLDGYDNDWSPATNKTSAGFGNISEGTYTFRLKAYSHNGLWSKSLNYTFSVLAPWWRTWLAYGIYLILFGGILYLLYRWKTASLLQEKKLLEEKVKERTKELKQANTEINEKNEELNQQNEEITLQKEAITFQAEELRVVNKDLSKKNKKLEELNHEQNSMMRIVAHDLKSPLNNIYSILHLLCDEKEELTQNEKEYFDLIFTVIDNGSNLIKDLTDIHQAEELQTKMNFQETEIDAFISGIIKLQQKQAETKNLKILYNASVIYPKRNIEQDFLRRIIDNLLSNAIKFSPFEKNIYIDLKDDTDHIIISIKDEGPGFSENDKEDIFKKFQKLSARPTNNEHSSGLGLSIVKALVERLKGEIILHSEKGEGAEFIIKIPGKIISTSP